MNPATGLYLRLLKRCLVRDIFPDGRYSGDRNQPLPFDPSLREEGKDWPAEAETMVGMKRLDNLESCCTEAISRRVPGDFVETGVWRGGCSILMRAVLKAFGDSERSVWLFDSFQGLPKPDSDQFPKDRDDSHWVHNYLGVPEETVRDNFGKYELLDDQVRFVKGWFRDTLPSAPVQQIAVLRLDGDMYESTWLALTCLYPKISPGGFAIIDDYGALPNCRAAVEDFRSANNITEPITPVDWTGVYWQKR